MAIFVLTVVKNMKTDKLSIRVTELEKDLIKTKANGNMSRYILRLIDQDDGTDWKGESLSYQELFKDTNDNLKFVSTLLGKYYDTFKKDVNVFVKLTEEEIEYLAMLEAIRGGNF